MEFKIVESNRNHNLLDYLKQFIAYIILAIIGFIIIPIVLITNLFKKKSSATNENKTVVENEWTEFMKSDKLTLYRKFINEEDVPDDLDFPKETYDIDLYEIKAEPELIELKDIFFDFKELETENGFYFISLNKTGKEMSLWNIDKISNEIRIVTKLKSLWWDLSIIENKITLKGIEGKKDYKIEIEEK